MNTYHGDTEARSSFGLLSEALTESIVGAAIEVHQQLGPGLLESVYEECLCQELRLRNIPFLAHVELPVVYKGRETGGTYRIDLIGADEVVVEQKAVEKVLSVHEAQLHRFEVNRKTGWPDHESQRAGIASRDLTSGSMICIKLRVSVSPWWMLSFRSNHA